MKDERVLQLCRCIVAAGGEQGVGLPIGNLTSQWFANLVLDRLDHFALERIRAPGYVRYMDDFALFANDKTVLQNAHKRVDSFLRDRLRLSLKQRATKLAPTSEGLPFLGWRVYRGTTRLRPENLKRIRGRVRHRLWEYRSGRIDETALGASLRAVHEHLRHGSTLSLRRGLSHLDGTRLGRSPPE